MHYNLSILYLWNTNVFTAVTTHAAAATATPTTTSNTPSPTLTGYYWVTNEQQPAWFIYTSVR